jgi:hypothetical protein
MTTNPQYQYIPVSIAVPVFASVVPVPAPDKAIPSDLWGIIQNTNYFTVRQHVKLFPKACMTCPPCAPQENTYSIYAGFSADAQSEIMRVDEVSDDWNRCCCKPFHPVRMEVRPFVPMPGDATHTDFSHIRNDMVSSWNTLTHRDRAANTAEIYKQTPPVLSFVR